MADSGEHDGIRLHLTPDIDHRKVFWTVCVRPQIFNVAMKQHDDYTEVCMTPMDYAKLIAALWDGLGDEQFNELMKQTTAIRGLKMLQNHGVDG